MAATAAPDWDTERIGTVRLLTRRSPDGRLYHVKLFKDGDIASALPSQVSPWLFRFDRLFDPPNFLHVGSDSFTTLDLQRLRRALKFQAWCGKVRVSLHLSRVGPRQLHV